MTYQEVSYPHTEIYNWFYPEKKARKSFLYEIQLGKCRRCQKGFAKDVLTVDQIKQIARIEERISKLEAEQKEREAQLADPALYNDFARAKPLMDTHRAGKEELESLYQEWEAAQEKLAAAAASLG